MSVWIATATGTAPAVMLKKEQVTHKLGTCIINKTYFLSKKKRVKQSFVLKHTTLTLTYLDEIPMTPRKRNFMD